MGIRNFRLDISQSSCLRSWIDTLSEHGSGELIAKSRSLRSSDDLGQKFANLICDVSSSARFPGWVFLTATAAVAAMGDPRTFRSCGNHAERAYRLAGAKLPSNGRIVDCDAEPGADCMFYRRDGSDDHDARGEHN